MLYIAFHLKFENFTKGKVESFMIPSLLDPIVKFFQQYIDFSAV